MATRANLARQGRVTAHYERTFFGPNPYSRDPVVVASLAFEPEAAAEGPVRCARLANRSRQWFSPPAPIERCGTPLGIGEFLASWTLTALNRWRGFLHAATAVEEDGGVLVALGYHNPELSWKALTLAALLFNRAHRPHGPEETELVRQLWEACALRHPDYQIAFLMQAARAAEVPYMPVMPKYKTWQFGWGARSELFLESQSARDSAIGERLSRDKPAGKAFLRGLGIPVPEHALVTREEDIARAQQGKIGWPCVVKPTDGGRSVGVTTDIADAEHLTAVVREALAVHPSVMIERQVPGEVYRILVARGRVACVVRRAAPHVVGDGTSTVRELIEARNRELAGLRSTMDFVGEIPFDAEFAAALAREGVGLDEVLDNGRQLSLRRVPLLSSGAVYTDVTGEAHPGTLRMAELIAAALGIENCGIDFITTDISRSMAEEGAVLEANTIPGLRVPMMAGLDPLAIARRVLGDHPARVPATLLVAPRETLAGLRGTLALGEAAGWAIDGTTGVGGLTLPTQPQSLAYGSQLPTHQGATMLVRNPLVESVFLVLPLEEVVADGLPLDKFDAIVCLGEKPDAAWEAVMRAASGTYAVAKTLPEALRKCGFAAPAKKSVKPGKR